MKIAVFLGLSFLLMGCKENKAVGPAPIEFGVDACDECKMIISDRVYAAQVRNVNETYSKFDDIGCLVTFMKKHRPTDVWVADFSTGQWLKAEAAHFVKSAKIKTPMASGIVAFADEASAAKSGTSALGWQDLISE